MREPTVRRTCLALCAGAVGLLLSAPLTGTATAADAAEIAALRALPCPDYQVVSATAHSDQARGAALNGDFYVLAKPAHLAPPVDWDRDPYRSRSWRIALHGFIWLDPLLYSYSSNGDVEALRQARDLALDWIDANPQGAGPPGTDYAWVDKNVGDRAGYLSYVTRAAACENLLTDGQASKLLDSAARHGRFLARPANYEPGNHGLFMDLGLSLLSTYFPFFEQSPAWGALASHRFEGGVRLSVNWREGVHLEHTPGYQFLMIDLIGKMIGYSDREDPDLVGIYQRMRQVAGWFVMPDGTITQLGDTGQRLAEPWALAKAVRLRGVSPTRRSGYAIAKEAGSYLSVAAGYHSSVHKQADELTFELYDRGRPIVRDTGRYGYYRGTGASQARALEFTNSSQAHSTLVADGESFSLGEDLVYGSGITGVGSGSGWYAIEGRNPLLKAQGVDHRRLFLYNPRTALVIVDLVESRAAHTYRRYFQLAPGISTRRRANRLVLADGGFRGALYDRRTKAGRDRRVVRGQTEPLLGWHSPGNWASWRPRPTAVYTSRGSDVEHVATFTLDSADPIRARLLSSSSDTSKLLLEEADGAELRLKVVRDGNSLRVSESPAR